MNTTAHHPEAAPVSGGVATGGIVRGWNRFWFSPADPLPLGVIRIFGGLVILYVHLIYSLDLVSLCGPDAWLDSATINEIRTKTPFSPMPTSWTPPASEPVSYGMPIWSVYFHIK